MSITARKLSRSKTVIAQTPGGMPGPNDFGPTGALTSGPGGTVYITTPGVYQNMNWPGDVIADVAGVTIKNSRASAFVSYYGNYTLQDCEAGYIGVDAYYRDIDNVKILRNKVNGSDGDGVNIFSSDGNVISNVEIGGLYAAGFDYAGNPSAHGDGIQIRGVTGLNLHDVMIDMGPWQQVGGSFPKNAALYIENVNEVRNVTITDVWLNGGGYTFYTCPAITSSATRMHPA